MVMRNPIRHLAHSARNALHWRVTFYAQNAREWCERIWYCHHNARVLVDTEHRLSCVLDHASGGMMSKPSYDWPTMREAINHHHVVLREEGYEDGYADAQEEHAHGKHVFDASVTAQVHA